MPAGLSASRWIIGVPLIILMFVLSWKLWLVLLFVGIVAAYFVNRSSSGGSDERPGPRRGRPGEDPTVDT